MPRLNDTLQPGATTAQTRPLIAVLQREMLTLGIAINDVDLKSNIYSSAAAGVQTTGDAVVAFKGQHEFAAPLTDACEVIPGKVAFALTAAIDGNSAELVTVLRELGSSANQLPPFCAARLARVAYSYRQLEAAKQLSTRAGSAQPKFRDWAEFTKLLTQEGRNQSKVEHLFPENFYSYRREPFGPDTSAIIEELTGAGVSARARTEEHEPDSFVPIPDDFPDDEPDAPAPPEDAVTLQDIPEPLKTRHRKAALAAADAMRQWQLGNANFAARRYRGAVVAYSSAITKAAMYFKGRHGVEIRPVQKRFSGEAVAPAPEDQLVWLRGPLGERRLAATLEELAALDWRAATQDVTDVIKHDILGKQVPPEPVGFEPLRRRLAEARHLQWDRMLFLIFSVFGPLARAEAFRMLGQPARGIADCERVLGGTEIQFPTPPRSLGGTLAIAPLRRVNPLCRAIEEPFVRALLAELLVERGDAEYQGRRLAEARATYQGAINQIAPLGAYVAHAATGLEALKDKLMEALPPAPVADPRTPLIAKDAFRTEAVLALGRDIYLPVFRGSDGVIPSVNRNTHAHQPLLAMAAGNASFVEANPRFYVVLLTAQFRLLQLEAGLNFLGYSDSYVPPWRFGYALDRARYFAQQAKSAHRDYLNFLATAEREEFQELTASQQIELEKSNVRLESARVDQALQSVEAAAASADLALVTAQNSTRRIDNFRGFDRRMKDLENQSSMFSGLQSLLSASAGFALITNPAGTAGKIAAGFLGTQDSSEDGNVGRFFKEGFDHIFGMLRSDNAQSQSELRRELELSNLRLAQVEADRGFNVAIENLDVAQAGLMVASLQREVSLLRHELAVQNVLFLASRNLNAEQWYRLAVVMQGIAVTYMRYAVELAFLAEQAYEFEADRQLNVIRFDYARADTGEFLAADMLLLDLDTLEQDQLVSRKSREQQVRYVLSMSTEFPEALDELRRHGKATFSLVLEQLERRLPGIFNARLVSVDVLPLALMDPSRFSSELTHLGYGEVRQPLRQGETPTEPAAGLSEAERRLETAWPRRQRIFGPETAVYSGLTKQDESAHFAYAAQGQRGAFEGRPAAGAWQIDFTARDNQIVPEGLADVLITFNIAGFHDSGLREMVEQAAPKQFTPTRHFSARSMFPDAYYAFDKSGRLSMELTVSHLTLTGRVGRLRNAGVLLVPATTRADFDHMFSRFSVDFRVSETGSVTVTTPILAPGVEPLPGNRMRATLSTPSGAAVSWQVDGSDDWVSGNTVELDLLRPGAHDVTLRVSLGGKMHQRSIRCYAAADGRAAVPLVVAPSLSGVASPATGFTRVRLQSESDQTVWSIQRHGAQSGRSVDFDLPPGEYTVAAVTSRPVRLRIYSSEKHVDGVALSAGGLSRWTNRRFAADGTNQTTGPNELTTHLFGADGKGELGVIGSWMIDLLPEDNTSLHRLPTGAVDLSALQDAVLVMEYDVET